MTKSMRISFHLLVLLTFLSPGFAVSADDESIALLERMSVASKQLNYDGVFVHQRGKKMRSVRIIHRSDESGEIERLISLNGAESEVIRNNNVVTCFYPDGKRVNVNRKPLGNGFPSDLLNRLKSAESYYEVSMGKQSRVAGRKVQGLFIKPIDKFRYGYFLWVDKESDLLLQSNLIGKNGEVLEKFSFSSIALNIDIPDEALQPEIIGREIVWSEPETLAVAERSDEENQSAWEIRWLPEGFSLTARQMRKIANNNTNVEQYVYSDGLSSVSIFIEKIRTAHGHLRGGSTKGAVNAFGTIIDKHYVTVVGQVPATTVERIGSSMLLTGEEQS